MLGKRVLGVAPNQKHPEVSAQATGGTLNPALRGLVKVASWEVRMPQRHVFL